jgi:predicted membrane channel-forming protein YqfA (hemolysin III family)
MFFSSATAHLMHQKSLYCHMTCFLCDFGGISFNAFGSSMMQISFVSPLWYYSMLEPYLLPLIGFQSALCILLNSIAQTNFKRPYPLIKRFLQFVPCGGLWCFSVLPLFFTYFWPDTDTPLTIHYWHHFGHIFLFLLGAFFFAADFPQRYFPGKLDFFGQGHNLFHLCIFGAVYLHIKACSLDYQANREIIAASRSPPTFSFCFVSLAAMVIYYVYLIRKFTQMIAHNFDKEGNLIKKQPSSREEPSSPVLRRSRVKNEI